MSDQPIQEKRDPRLLGRRKHDHADGQIVWLDNYFRDVIKSEFERHEARETAAQQVTLEKALGDIPRRLKALERFNETRQLRTCLIALSSSLIGGGCVVASMFFSNILRWV